MGLEPATIGLEARCPYGPRSGVFPDSERWPKEGGHASSLLLVTRLWLTRGFCRDRAANGKTSPLLGKQVRDGGLVFI